MDVFYDLVTDDGDFAHRLAVYPCRIAPALAPVVDRMNTSGSVQALLEVAPSLLPPGFAQPDDLHRAVIDIVRVANLKGFVRLHKPRYSEPTSRHTALEVEAVCQSS